MLREICSLCDKNKNEKETFRRRRRGNTGRTKWFWGSESGLRNLSAAVNLKNKTAIDCPTRSIKILEIDSWIGSRGSSNDYGSFGGQIVPSEFHWPPKGTSQSDRSSHRRSGSAYPQRIPPQHPTQAGQHVRSG
nr:uncharacterized protein LOC109416592 [Aedes albopictus]XP_029734366.1 uncharacterized protein LOC109403342 [Aedes albopictus]